MEYMYDKIYSKNSNTFGIKNKLADFILSNIEGRGKLLDLGVGQGSLAVPLAKAGFEVEGVDLSQVGLNQFLEFAKSEGVKVKAVHSDFENYSFKDNFDMIISHVSLQFLGDIKKIGKIINRMKEHTKIGGYNYVSVPTQTRIAIDFDYMFKDKGELFNYYRDWELIFVDELEGSYSNGKTGTTARLLVRRTK